jgi:NAD-dependent SIR2 family protein deacetylase
MSPGIEEALAQAVDAIRQADALLIGAGAGMGVDSGLPDFRGPGGFWRAYPPYRDRRLEFSSIANPRWFREEPALAWGFYGHRLNLYRSTEPHEGFAILAKWADSMNFGAFIYTSNVDGQFQRAGFDADQILEAHGAIDWLQCLNECGIGVFAADGIKVEVDESTMLAVGPLPHCPRCGSLARPNILMFGDYDFDGTRVAEQRVRLRSWLETIQRDHLVAIECGAGIAIPTVRLICEDLAEKYGGTLIRINPGEPEVPRGHLSLELGALEALERIDALIDG